MSTKQQKDKRTKGQILRLLDKAIEQEERLSLKIKSLEAELVECRKKAENPRHELTEGALPASKVSFRIDYYRTAKKGPLKGIIEHLPSRQNKAFEGEGQLIINHFVNRFLHEEAGKANKKKTSVPNIDEEIKVDVVEADDSVEDTTPSFSEQPIATRVEQNELPQPAKMGDGKKESLPAARYQPEVSPATTTYPKTNIIPEKVAQPYQNETDTQSGSRLLRKLKAKFERETQAGGNLPPSLNTHTVVSESTSLVERLRKTAHILPEPQTTTERGGIAHMEAAHRPSLLERLQEKHKISMESGAGAFN